MRSYIYCVALLSVLFISAINGQADDIPTLLPPAEFDAVADAQALNTAMAGIGTDELAIIEVLCYRVASQRATITETYNRLFGSNLVTDLIGETAGSFQAIAVSLTYSMSEMLAIELFESLTQAGTDEDSVVEVLLSRTNDELNAINNDFLAKYGYSLVTRIQLDTTGSLQDFLVVMAEGKRDESTTVDSTLVQSDVTRLYDAGAGQAGTDEAVFVEILGQRSYAHINSVSDEYVNRYNSTLEEDVQSEFIGNIQNALLDTLQYARSKATYFAARLRDSIFGAGTNNRNLDRQHISRCEIDMGNIKTQYQEDYGVSLASDVAGDTSGSHQAALLALLG